MNPKNRISRLVTLVATLVLTCTLFVVGASAASTAQEKLDMAEALNSIGLFRGYDESGTNFGLNDVPTREQALIFQIRALGEEKAAMAWKGTSPYTDVPNDHWALCYIGYGTQKGYTNGMAPGVFGLGKSADAKMMTTFVLRGMGYSDIKASPDFTYNESVLSGYQLGLNESAVAPTSFKRGDAVVILYNALGCEQKSGGTLADALVKKGIFTTEDLLVAQAIAKGEPVGNVIKADFDFVNLTGKQINKLYMTTSNTDDWGANILGTSVFKSGYTLDLEIAFTKTTKYDVLVEYSTGASEEFRNVSFASATKDGGTIVLKSGGLSVYPLINLPITFVNNTGLSVTSLKASSSLVDTWSSNLVSTLSNNASTTILFPMTAYDTEWDIQIIAGSKTYNFANLDLSKASTSGITLYLTMENGNLVISNSSGIQPTKIGLYWSQVSVVVGKSFSMPAILTPSNAQTAVTYTSSNTAVAKVDSKGTVTALKSGTATITAKTANGLSATCLVTATTNTAPTKVEMDASALEMKVGQTYDLNGRVYPLGGTINQTWTSSVATVAKVSGSGVVTALKPGTTTITVKTYNGKSDTCKVTVTGDVASSVTLNKASTSIGVGETAQLTATVLPAAASQTVTWTTSDKSIATVSTSGLVTGVKEGIATITATTENGKVAVCGISVMTLPPYSVSVSPALSNAKVGDIIQLSATVRPDSASQTVKWSSDNPSVVSVDDKGVATCVGAGTATIHASAVNDKSGSCKIVVTDTRPQLSTGIFDMANGTGKTIIGLYMTPSNNDDWGKNLLPSGMQLKNLQSGALSISFAKDTKYDIQLVYSDGSQSECRGLSFSGADDGGGVIALSETQATLYPCDTISLNFVDDAGGKVTGVKFICSDVADGWGQAFSSASGDLRVCKTRTCSFTMQVTMDNGDVYEYTNVKLDASYNGATVHIYKDGNTPMYKIK